MASDIPGTPAMATKPLRLEAERLQREGDLAGAFKVYEAAVALAPEDPELLMALADLAGQLEMNEVAVGLWAHVNRVDPAGRQAADGYARALIAAARFPEAIDVLKSALQRHPQEPRLWTTLGLALTYAGRATEALTFFDEGVRLDPSLAAAVYNRGLALCDLGRLAEADAEFQAACRLARTGSERATIEFSRATLALGRGDLKAGWALYEHRLSPDWPKSVAFQGVGERLVQGDSLAGRRVLVLAEQGIGDEILFANTLPDLVNEIGQDGRLILAVDARLVDLFQRSFPTAEVCAHATPRVGTQPHRQTRDPVRGPVDFWTPLASLAQRYRCSIADFPRSPFLRPDPARVEYWRSWLGHSRPTFGITWRSGMVAGERQRFAPPLPGWTSLLQTPGVQFVNIQYGDCAQDLAQLKQMSGVELRQPLGLNVKDDLDDLAALCTALDGVVSIQNATGALAGACGAPVVFLARPGSWPQLGQERPPWFADARICAANDVSDWAAAMSAATEEVRQIAAAGIRSTA